jgi:LmbE family N-acetylglucosaminyl deacetylase
MQENILVISPHFDDACYSIGGFLSQNTSKKLILLTVFSKSMVAPTTHFLKPVLKFSDLGLFRNVQTRYVSSQRKKEDLHYCKSLNAKHVILPFQDYSLRRYKADPKLGSNSPSVAKSFETEPIFESVLKAIQPVLKSSYDSIFCPLAIGGHVDHLIVYTAAKKLLKSGLSATTNIYFYEDLPYASRFDLDEVTSCAIERSGANKPSLINITCDIQSKLSGIALYSSQYSPEVTMEIFAHAKRLSLASPEADLPQFSERIWKASL